MFSWLCYTHTYAQPSFFETFWYLKYPLHSPCPMHCFCYSYNENHNKPACLTTCIITLYSFFFLVSCQPSDRISFIHDIRTCNDSNLTVSFNLTDADCTHYGYHIVVIHNVSQTEKPSKQLLIPYRYNGTNICHFFLTLDDAVTADEFHNSRLQIRIYNNTSPLLCSNYFRILVDEGKLNLSPSLSLPPSLPPFLSPSLSPSLPLFTLSSHPLDYQPPPLMYSLCLF